MDARTGKILAAVVAASIIAGGLTACGGGGGGSSPAPAPVPAPPPPPPPPPPAGNVTLSGTATYDSVRSSPAGPLDYATITAKPIRGALVQAINPATNGVYATTSTDVNGFYSVAVPANVNVQVVVNAQLFRDPTGPLPRYNISVVDNTSSNALYALGQTCASGAAGNTACNLRAASGWGGAGYTSTRAAGPFSILDTAYASVQRVLQANPNASFPSLNMHWSVNNRPASGCGADRTADLAQGCIGTSFYGGSSGGVHRLYILGAANTDTDEYDVHVVAHEWGHYFQGAFSRNDAPGGSHTGNELQDFRLSFSEGWGNAWSGMVWNDPIYRDSLGTNQSQGFAVNVSQRTGTGGARDTLPAGWFREDTVQYVLWSLYNTLGRDAAGFTPIYTVLTDTSFAGGSPLTGIHAFAAALRALNPTAGATLTPILADQGIATTADGFGSGETNGAGQAGVLPVYVAYPTLGSPVQVCVSNANGNGNKLRNFAYVRVTVPTTRSYTITVTDTAANPVSDPDFDVVQGRFINAGLSGNVGSETLTGVSLQAGTAVVVVEDFNLPTSTSAPNTSRCFNININ